MPTAAFHQHDVDAHPAAHDVVILAGGSGRRLGGVDKATVEVGGRPLLSRVLAAVRLTGPVRVTVVGPRRHGFGSVDWLREDPPGTGPLAALAAGLAGGCSPLVVVLATDLALIDAPTVERLLAACRGDEWAATGAVLLDGGGVRQPLAGVYRRRALAEAYQRIGDPRDRPVRLLFDHLSLVDIPAGDRATDVDDIDDLCRVERRLARMDPTRR